MTQFAKKTGDYSALSHADLCVLALTYALDKAEKLQSSGEKVSRPLISRLSLVNPLQSGTSADATPSPTLTEGASHSLERDDADRNSSGDEQDPQGETKPLDDAVEYLGEAVERLEVELVPLNEDSQVETRTTLAEDTSSPHDSNPPHASVSQSTSPLSFEDPVDDDDDEGEWITPENVSLHKARALGLTPSDHRSGTAKNKEIIPVGCMTADFAMQNVLLQMGLSLVGMEGKKIQKVKTWVLRCHACFKWVRHYSGIFATYLHAGYVRMRQRSSARPVAIPPCFAHPLLYRPLLGPQMHLPCKCI